MSGPHRSDPATGPDRERIDFEEQLSARLTAVYGAHPWLATSEVDQGAVRLASAIRAVDGAPVMAVGARPGVGQVDDTIPLLSIGLAPEASMMAGIRTAAEALRNPPREIRAAVDRWDPERRAKSIGVISITAGELLGRPTFGARPRRWLDLEDKLAVEELWHAAGVVTAPSTQVAVDDEAELIEAHRRLATELGTVWAVDNDAGWHGGAEGTHWIADVDAAQRLAGRLGAHRKVRIMPFVEGVVCSIHGMVLPDETVTVFRPCELMMLRDHASHRFVYGRASTHWDPGPADRRAMRAAARRIGTQLRRRVGYRGTFTVDGVLGEHGFVPTEVNTRFGAALPSQIETLAGPPIDLFLVHLALVEGLLDDLDLAHLERWVVRTLDETRRMVGFVQTADEPPEPRTGAIVRSPDGDLTLVTTQERPEDEDPSLVADVDWGRWNDGGLVIFQGRGAIPTGPPSAPLLIELIEAADRHWELGLPRLTPARDVRRRPESARNRR